MAMFRLQMNEGENPMAKVLNASKGAMDGARARYERTQEDVKASAKALKILKPAIQARILRPDQHAKAGRILNRMEEAGYSHEQINDVVAALVANQQEDMRPAYDLFAGGDGVIDAEEMRTVVPLIGEDMTDDQVGALFRLADQDNSGQIDFHEFCKMMFALTPKAKGSGGLLDINVALVEGQDALQAGLAQVDSDPTSAAAINALAEGYAKLIAAENAMAEATQYQNPEPVTALSVINKTVEGAQKVGQNFESLKSLQPEVQARIFRPKDHQRAGRIIQRMNRYDAKSFSRADINSVIKSLVAFEDAEMDEAFDLWAGEDGRIDAAEFQEVVPLLGEDLTEEEINCMFAAADSDGSGHIDKAEFCTMMNQMQMKGDGTERYKLVGMARATAYANSKI